MDAQAATRLNQGIDILFARLNAGRSQDDLRFYRNNYGKLDFAFGIMEKRRDGDRNNRRFDHGPITVKQCDIIEQTSQSVEEIAERMRLLIIEKKDTTKISSPRMVSLDEVEAVAEKKLADLLASPRIAELLASRGTAGTAKAVAEQVVAATLPPEAIHVDQTVYVRKPKGKRESIQTMAKRLDAAIALWTERDKQLGGDGKLPFLRNRRVIKPGWVNKRQRDWDAFCLRGQQTVPSA
jgi:hypothetical protein